MAAFHGYFFLFCFFFFFFFFFFSSCYSAVSTGELEMENLNSEDVLVHEEMTKTAGYGEEKLSSVLVTGTLLCEACLDGEPQAHAWHVQDASVAVICKTGGKRRNTNFAVGTTDEYGDFIVELPSHLHAKPKLDKACTVRVLQLPKSSPCRRVFLGKPKGIRLSSVGNGIRTYTTGTIRFQPKLKAWQICSKEASDLEEERSW